MDFRLSAEDEKFRQEVIEFLNQEFTSEHELEMMLDEDTWSYHGQFEKQLLRKLGEKSWYVPTIPKEYGGMGSTHIQRWIIYDELSYRMPKVIFFLESVIAPIILHFGSEEQKRQFLPKIAKAEEDFAIGYTEPEAGTDLAALQMRAIREGDFYVINGQKIFSGHAHIARYHFLLARTDPNVPKHKGISLFIVDLNTPGISIDPMMTMCGTRTNQVYYDNVRVPIERLVGEENRGWYYAAEALDHERAWLIGRTRRLFDEMIKFVQKKRDSHPIADSVRHQIADMAACVRGMSLLGWKVAWMQDQGKLPTKEISMLKVYQTELHGRIAYLFLEIMGLYGQLERGSKWGDIYYGYVPVEARRQIVQRFGGGGNDVLRDVIAQRGLGLPRGR